MHEQNYYYKALEFKSLYKAMKRCCRNLRWKDSVAGYEFNGLRNTYLLKQDLISGNYRISKYQEFVIYEPKRREIVATRFRDRQFQMSLCQNGLYDDVVEHLINDNPACQTNKGTDYFLNRMKAQLRRYYKKYKTNEGWVLHCDIKKFFPSTDHDIAKRELRKYITDDDALYHICNIIDSFNNGIGLGSQISQLIELAILNQLDHIIKEKLKPDLYCRYMDDLTLVHHNKDELKTMLNQIRIYLGDMKFSLNNKTQIYPLYHGVKILKWHFYLIPETGKIVMKMDKSKMSRQRKRLKKLWVKEINGLVKPGATKESLRSFLANAQRGNTYSQRRNMIRFYEKITNLKYN